MTPLMLACSGPGAMRVIQDNILYAQQQAMVVAAIAAASITLWFFRRRWKALPLLVITLLLIHPAWTISAIKGDCGFLKADATTFVTAAVSACVALQALAWAWQLLREKAPNHRLQLTGNGAFYVWCDVTWWRKACTALGLMILLVSIPMHLWWRYVALRDGQWFLVLTFAGIAMVLVAARYRRLRT